MIPSHPSTCQRNLKEQSTGMDIRAPTHVRTYTLLFLCLMTDGTVYFKIYFTSCIMGLKRALYNVRVL